MRNDFIDSLVSDSPHQKYKEKLMLFGQFIGSWDFKWIGHEVDGSSWSVPGEWIFSWILEGRAIQDNWICPGRIQRRSGRYSKGEYGTTIRFYDFKEDILKTVWIGPVLSQMNFFRTEQKGNDIALNEIEISEKQKRSRWVFTDIEKDSFRWLAHISKDYGKSWRMNQEVIAERKN